MGPSDRTGLCLISLASATPLANPIGYAGYVYLPDFGTLGHWLARHRIFDPVMGRWITRDPAGYVDGMSLYLYARGNPWMFVDPLGLFVGQFIANVCEGARVVVDTLSGALVDETTNSANAAASVESRLAQKAIERGDQAGADQILRSRESASISQSGAELADQTGDAIRDVAVEVAMIPVGGAVMKVADKAVDAVRGVDAAVDASKVSVSVGGNAAQSAPGLVDNAANALVPHKNSLDYVGETHVYRIRGPDGSTYKIGQSSQGTRVADGASIRAEQQARRLTRETGERYATQIRRVFPDKASARSYETRVIERFRSIHGQNTLPGNVTNR